MMGGHLSPLKIFSTLYNERGGDDPKGPCLTSWSMHIILFIKNIWYKGGMLTIFKILLKSNKEGVGITSRTLF